MKLTVRPYSKEDIALIASYFLDSPKDFLENMGVKPDKVPSRPEWEVLLSKELEKPFSEMDLFYIIWEVDGIPSGHSNINNIHFGRSASMHLHLWQTPNRRKGMGTEFVKRSVPYYFEHFDLQTLFCEPFSQNPAPNATLPKAGFHFIQTHTPPAGWISPILELNQWTLSRERYKSLYANI